MGNVYRTFMQFSNIIMQEGDGRSDPFFIIIITIFVESNIAIFRQNEGSPEKGFICF